MEIKLYLANCQQNPKNCSYPKEAVCSNPDELKEAIKFDYVGSKFLNGRRSTTNFLSSNWAILDCDNDHSDDPKDWITPENIRKAFDDVAYVLVPSRNNMKVKNGVSARPRFHMFFLIAEVTNATEYANLKQNIYEMFSFFDKNALDAARLFFGCDVEVDEIDWHEGPSTIDQIIGLVASVADTDDTIPQGERNATLYQYATRVLKRYGATQDAHEAFLVKAEKCDPPLDNTELESIWKSAQKFYSKISSQPGYIAPNQYQNPAQPTANASVQSGPQAANPPANPPRPPTGSSGAPQQPANNPGYLIPKDYSDIGQADVFSKTYQGSLAYTPATGYLAYKLTHWSDSAEQDTATAEEFLDRQLEDSENLVSYYTKALKREGLPLSLKQVPPGTKLTKKQQKLFTGLEKAKEYHGFVARRREMRYIKSLLEAARPKLQVKVEDLDSDPHLLNAPGATYCLDKGLAGKRPHNAADLITKITAVDPSDKGMDIWLDALDKFFCGNHELIDYVQQIMGLAIIGRVNLEALIMAFGGGANGKSTFFNTIRRVLGTYAGMIASDVLLKTTRNVMPAIAELRGKRFVIAAELGEDAKLSSERVKKICSTDDISAEKKYHAPFDFTPSHTVVLYTNYLPDVEARDNGTWRRLLVIPFNATFTGSNDKKQYANYLFDNAGEAVLAWLIEGAQRIIANGFDPQPPQIVIDACNSYRHENDWLSAFIEECCDIDSQAKVKAGELQQEFRTYCLRTSGSMISAKAFSQALIDAGFQKKRESNGNFIFGLKLKDDDDGLLN